MDPRLHAKGQSKENDRIGYVKTHLIMTSKIYVQKKEPKLNKIHIIMCSQHYPTLNPATFPSYPRALYLPKKSRPPLHIISMIMEQQFVS